MSADNILFHPSGLGKIMSGTGKGWPVAKSLTCKRELIRIYREIKYDRYYSFTNKYTEKGIRMEDDSITLYSRFRKELFNKNTKRISNDYFTGEPDIIHDKETIDLKTSWSINTFPHSSVDEMADDYIYQGRAYMDLTGAEKHTVAFCLVNAPANLITKEQEKLYYNMNCPTLENKQYLRGLIDIEKNMIYDIKQFLSDNPGHDLHCREWEYDIPIEERVVEFVIHRDRALLDEIYARLTDARQWMNEHLFKINPLAV